MILINLATIDFGGGSGSAKPLITQPLIANVWSRGRRVFTPANYNVDGFSDVTINTAVIGENSALDFSLIGWDNNESDDVNTIYNADIEYSKSVLDKWNNGEIRNFQNDEKLKYVPLINTSNVTNMSNFFSGCNSLINVPLINTSNVTHTTLMFSNCSNLTTIPLIDTSNVTSMWGMFSACKNLITIPQIDTSNVTDMKNMFSVCNSLINVPQIDTSNVTDMYSMFYECKNLTTIPLIDTSNVTNMKEMFAYCKNLITIPQINTSNVTDMYSMFDSCTNLTSLPLLDCSKVNSIGYFIGYSFNNNLTELGGFKNLKIDWNDNNGLCKCPNLTYNSIKNVLNNLYNFRANGDNTTTRTIKINSNTYNLLTADDIATVNAKGWVITT